MKKITECAQKVGIQVVDQFVPLKALTRSNPDLVARDYNLNEEEFDQMTPNGNEHAAQVLAAVLKEQASPGHGMTSPEGGASPPRSSELPDRKVLPN